MDWIDIKPLKEPEALKIVLDYFSKHGLNPVRIETLGLPNGQRSPDILGIKNGRNCFVCEVKTPSNIFNQQKGLYMWSTTFNKLRGRIHTAVKQFTDFDKNHLIPWVVAFTSNHPQMNWTQLQHNILGAVRYGDRTLQNFNGKTFVVDTNNDIRTIDIFLLFQINYVNRSTIVELAIYQNFASSLSNEVNFLVSELTPKAEENIKAPNYFALN